MMSMNLWTLSRDTNMALGNIIVNLFDDIVPGLRKTMGGVDTETGMLEKLKKPEIVIGPEGVANLISRAEPETQRLLKEEETIAYRMLEEGEGNQNIEARTGFFFDDDGAIRREIDDNEAKLTKSLEELNKPGFYKLNEVFSYPDFFAIYPQLSNAKIEFYKGKDPTPDAAGKVRHTSGYLDLKNNSIGININTPAFKYQLTDDINSVIRTVLHESQHMIQNIEGLQGGSNSKMFQPGGIAGLNLSPDAAYKRYLKTIGEAESRNVEARFGKKKARDFVKTLYTDWVSKQEGINKRDAIKISGEKVVRMYDEKPEPEVEDLNANPFGIDPTLRGM
jgi:hypothetical protein